MNLKPVLLMLGVIVGMEMQATTHANTTIRKLSTVRESSTKVILLNVLFLSLPCSSFLVSRDRVSNTIDSGRNTRNAMPAAMDTWPVSMYPRSAAEPAYWAADMPNAYKDPSIMLILIRGPYSRYLHSIYIHFYT